MKGGKSGGRITNCKFCFSWMVVTGWLCVNSDFKVYSWLWVYAVSMPVWWLLLKSEVAMMSIEHIFQNQTIVQFSHFVYAFFNASWLHPTFRTEQLCSLLSWHTLFFTRRKALHNKLGVQIEFRRVCRKLFWLAATPLKSGKKCRPSSCKTKFLFLHWASWS